MQGVWDHTSTFSSTQKVECLRRARESVEPVMSQQEEMHMDIAAVLSEVVVILILWGVELFVLAYNNPAPAAFALFVFELALSLALIRPKEV